MANLPELERIEALLRLNDKLDTPALQRKKPAVWDFIVNPQGPTLRRTDGKEYALIREAARKPVISGIVQKEDTALVQAEENDKGGFYRHDPDIGLRKLVSSEAD